MENNAGGTSAGSSISEQSGTVVDGAVMRVRVMETTDLHMNILPYDYFADRPTDTRGLARTASLIAQARAEVGNSLLFDIGDFLQGTPMADLFARERPAEPHPMISAMNVVGYDAVTLGNHEFSYGLDMLRRVLARAEFPVVTANALRRGRHADEDETLFAPTALLERRFTDTNGQHHTLRIGVIGLLPPNSTAREHGANGPLRTLGMAKAARIHVPLLRASGADLVIALAHTGIGASDADEDEAALVLAGIEGIDALLCGHRHKVFPGAGFSGIAGVDPVRGTVGGKPVLMAGFWGSHLGVLDLELTQSGDRWGVTGFHTETRAIYRRDASGQPQPTVPSDPRVVAAVQSAHDETLAHIRRPVAQTKAPIHSYFSLVAPDAGLSLVAEAQRAHVAQSLAGRPESGLPILSAVAPFKCGGRSGPEFFIDIPAGTILRSHVSDLYIYPNTIKAVQVSGIEVAEWLERSAGIFNTIRPDRHDQLLINPDVPSYEFDVIAGLTYEIDLTQPARYTIEGVFADAGTRRIRNLSHNGRAVRDDDSFIVSSNSFRISGNGAMVCKPAAQIMLGDAKTTGEALLEQVGRVGTLAPTPERIWRFSPIPGASAVFETGPRALDHLEHAPDVRLESLGLASNGFVQMRLHF